MVTREPKITLGEMRALGGRGLLVSCADYRCTHAVRISGTWWAGSYRLLSHYSSVRRAAEGEPISGRTGIGNYRDALVADRSVRDHFVNFGWLQEPTPLRSGCDRSPLGESYMRLTLAALCIAICTSMASSDPIQTKATRRLSAQHWPHCVA
jgi:hypothetical protein